MEKSEILKKKMVAAVTGVLYLKNLEEQAKQRFNIESPNISPSTWALYGRQTIMQMRSLLQRRVLKR